MPASATSQVDKFILVSLDYPGINSAFDTTICYEVDMFCFTSLGHTDNCVPMAMLLDRENVTQGSILRTERARLGDER